MLQPIVRFSWTPLGDEISYTIAGTTYPPQKQADNTVRASDVRYDVYSTPTNTPITFTQSVIMPAGVQPIEYRWDFGDGTGGFGPTVIHEFRARAPETRVRLTVLDDDGHQSSGSRILTLYAARRAVLRPALRVVTA